MEMNTFITFYILGKRIIYDVYIFLNIINARQAQNDNHRYTLWSVRVDCFTHAVYESLRGSMNSLLPFSWLCR